ncbi:GspL/Epsl periplasmic domain-containing protein [Desulfobacula sp.]|uniref:GspL/Epsl periplasmic domain-containing protein n=1 Tax=Desulfobacula sp. TaxID=2593537 RepID=UPI0026194DD7|nr:GspL/Epsl periplasmic domain-containing protein [Desulfobacula sp.]
MSTSVLTIDIQQDQISSAILSQGLKGIRIVETACSPMVEMAEADVPFQAVKKTLIPLLEKLGQGYDRCVISLPLSCFFFRTLDLPFKNRKKISQILSLELERYLPWPVEDVISDFCLLPKNSKDAFETTMAGVASIQTGHLEQFKTIFSECGVHPDVITAGSGYGSALVYAGTADPDAFCLFAHVEPLLASVYAVRWGELVFTRTVSFDADHPVPSITKNLIHTVLSVNEMFTNPLELKEIVLSGTVSFLPTLVAETEKELAMPVRVFDMLIGAQRLPIPESVSEDPPDVIWNAIAMGVNEIKGVETFNFSRQVSDLALFYQENKSSILVSAVLSFFLFLAWTLNPMVQMNRMERQIEQLDTRIVRVFKSCFPDVTTIVDPVHQMQLKVAALTEKKNLAVFDGYPLCIDVLNEISNSLPPSLDIVFSRFVRAENNLIVTGSAAQFNTIDKMKNHFKNIALFKEVDIHSASMDKKDKRVTFNLKIVL